MGISVPSQSSNKESRPCLELLLSLPFFAALAVAQTYAQGTDCNQCESDILADVQDCKDNSSTDAIVKCVLEALKTSADCIPCVCDILADVFGMDRAVCQK